MAIDVLPDELVVFDRDEWATKYKRSLQFRDPDADVRDGTSAANDAAALADQLQILSQNARVIGQSIPLSSQTFDQLKETAEEIGVPSPFPAVGSQGYVTAKAPTGTRIFSGDELVEFDSGLRFQCLATADYANGQPVPIAAIDVGPQTNLDAGTVLQWSSPRPGCDPNTTIVEQSDGSGLSGGRETEGRDEFEQRIADARANPPASGNDAEYQRRAENSLGHGVSVEKAFTYPACLGPGTMGVAFTLKPAKLGGSRTPNPAQTGQVRDFVAGKLPADDGYLEVMLIDFHLDIVLDVAWADGAKDWVDAAPWPPRYDPHGTPGAIGVTAATSPTTFTLDCLNLLRTGVVQPAVGQTIGFYNQATGKFARKKLASVTGTGPWVVVAETANSASDTSYTPAVAQRACPWSDSLDLLVPTILTEFGRLGPGEQQATFFDPGLRQKRSPAAPRYWPAAISNRLAGDLLAPGAASGAIQDAVVREGLGTQPPIGVPGATAFLLELGFITAFPLG